jgi:DNA replication protein DnaC
MTTDLKSSMLDNIESMQRSLEASPHRCRGGCGEHMMRPNILCGACDDKLRAAAQQAKRLASLKIPSRLGWATFDVPDLRKHVLDSDAIAKAKDAAADTRIDRIVLQGTAGSGKSVLAACILRRLFDEDRAGYSPVFFDGFRLAVARAHSQLGNEAEDVTEAMEASVLVFDDLGAGKVTAHDATPDVVFRRHADELPTIYTIGFPREDVRAKFGDGVYRRIYESAIVIQVGPEAVAP